MIKIQIQNHTLFGDPRCSCFLKDGAYEADLLILQDLNGTLAMKFSAYQNGGGVSYRPENDVYCPELCAELADPRLFVVIVTARGVEYREQTMAQLQEHYPAVNIRGYIAREGQDKTDYRRICDFKPLVLRSLAPHIGMENILMIESNNQTHEQYAKSGGKYIVNRKEFLKYGGISGFREFRERFISRAYQRQHSRLFDTD